MTYKQKRFCEEYIVDFNGTRAAIRAGYSPRSAYSIASENMRKPEISDYIARLTRKLAEKNFLSADRVCDELSAVAFGQWGYVSVFDKFEALERLRRYLQD